MSLDLILQRIGALEKQTPASFRWGTITSLSPLSVLLGGDTDPIQADFTVAGPVLVGDMVLTLTSNRKVTILGRAGGQLGGKSTHTTTASSWVDRGGLWWAHETSISAPFTRPPGYAWDVSVQGSDLWGTINIKTQSASSAQVCFLANKASNPGSQTLTVLWKLVAQ